MVLDGHIHIMHESIEPQRLLSGMRSSGVDGGIVISMPPGAFFPNGVVQPAETRLENLMRWQAQGSRLYPFFWVDPLEEDAVAQVDAAAGRGVAGFKIICDRFYPGDERVLKVCRQFAALGKPVLFHSGILWDGKPSSKYNRPVEFEALLDVPGLRFAMAHIGWPWCDEMIALYGKLASARSLRSGAPIELFIDMTPGTPRIYREEALGKLVKSGYDVARHLYFGSDCVADRYDSQWTADWIAVDKEILAKQGYAESSIDDVFCHNLQRFLGQA